jgi:hypothetical protein
MKTNYEQTAEMICELPATDVQTQHNRFPVNIIYQHPADTKAQLQALLLQAPTWTDAEYNNYLQTHKHLNQLRTQ